MRKNVNKGNKEAAKTGKVEKKADKRLAKVAKNKVVRLEPKVKKEALDKQTYKATKSSGMKKMEKRDTKTRKPIYD
jgi:hypothetical protein